MKHRQVEAETARHFEPEGSRRSPGDREVEEVEDQVMRSREESCVVCRSWRGGGGEPRRTWGQKSASLCFPVVESSWSRRGMLARAHPSSSAGDSDAVDGPGAESRLSRGVVARRLGRARRVVAAAAHVGHGRNGRIPGAAGAHCGWYQKGGEGTAEQQKGP